MNLHKIMIGIGILLLVFIPIWLMFIVPQLEKMPRDYEREFKLFSTEQTRYEIGSELSEKTILNGFIKLNSNKANRETIFIDELFHVEYLDGTISYETLNDYEVDRNSQKLINDNNVYFMFPPKLKKQNYDIVFPGWENPIKIKFIKEETVDGLDVYRYDAIIDNLDLTSSFEFLDLVPEKYGVSTDSESYYLVEPISGILVNYEETGTNYYVTKERKGYVQDFSIFSNTFGSDTIANQVRLAQNEKQRIYLIEWIVPILLALIGIALIFASFIGRKFIHNEEPTLEKPKPVKKIEVKKDIEKSKKPLVTFDKNKEGGK